MEVAYYSPVSWEEAVKLLAEDADHSKILAGGTDLIIQLKQKNVKPAAIIDITRIPGIRDISVNSNEVCLGSAVTFTQVAEHKVLRGKVPVLTEAAEAVGSPQIRNRGTLGGNIANASPAADVVPALLALDTLVWVRSIRGERKLKLEDVLVAPGRTNLAADEVITKLSFQIPGENTKSAFVKLGRRNALAIARMNLALVVTFEAGTRITEKVVMALGAVGPTAYLYRGVHEALAGRQLTDEAIERAAVLTSEEVAARLGTRSTAHYKKEAVKGIVYEAFYRILHSEYGAQ